MYFSPNCLENFKAEEYTGEEGSYAVAFGGKGYYNANERYYEIPGQRRIIYGQLLTESISYDNGTCRTEPHSRFVPFAGILLSQKDILPIYKI